MRTPRLFHGSAILFWTSDTEGNLSVLLGRRCTYPAFGKWSEPGGSWDRMDGRTVAGTLDLRKTAIRETWEEVGLRIDEPDRLVPIWSMRVPYFTYVVYAFKVPEQIDPPAVQEFSEVAWWPADALPKPIVWFVRSQVNALRRHAKRTGDAT